MRTRMVVAAMVGISLAAAARGGEREPMARAHSHNDYEQRAPLADALGIGYRSVEVDVWWKDGRVLVAHLPFGFKGSLEALYLDPLQARVDRVGSVHGDGEPFLLWIDIKESTRELQDALRSLFERYRMFAPAPGASGGPPVVAILTGDERAKTSLASALALRPVCRDSNRFSQDDPPADGRWTWYALRWRDRFRWDGHGSMPEAERDRLRALVGAVHAKGRRLRLFHTPETESFWAEALAAGVDLVGTDRIGALGRFLERQAGRIAAVR